MVQKKHQSIRHYTISEPPVQVCLI